MSQIISIENNQVRIGTDDGKIVAVPIASVNYANPQPGDRVNVFQDNGNYVVVRDTAQAGNTTTNTTINNINNIPGGVNTKRINKHVFVWVGTFLFGGFGVDRFMRGQVGAGICKLLFGWMTFGIWSLVDWIIALTKCYGSSCPGDEVVFINGKYAN